MGHPHELRTRFGTAAARSLATLLARPPGTRADFSPAPPDRCRGALLGVLAGEALPAILQRKRPLAGPETRFTLVAADAVLSGYRDHPIRFAARLAATDVRGAGAAAQHARTSLRKGVEWWRAGAPHSAGAAAAARSTSFGLLWSDDPERAAFEAALSATVTHGHPAAVAGAAALAAAIALAANGEGPLNAHWLASVADVCAQYPQGDVQGANVADQIRSVSLNHYNGLEAALAQFGGSAVATEAIPLALLCATTAPEPFISAFGYGSPWDPRAAASMHPACRAMMGACIGARHGASTWTDWGKARPPHWGLRNMFAHARAHKPVLATADRIAGRRVKPVKADRKKKSEEESDRPVHVSFLIDRSGSMSGLESDVVDGFNGFVAKQRAHSGACTLSLVQFDSNDPFEVIHDAVPVDKVPDLDPDQYEPRGATPLLDALGTLVEAADDRLAGLDHEEDQIVTVFTDGLENASRHWTRADLFDLIAARKDAGWTFVFMGANQDSYAEGGMLGVDAGSIQDFRGDAQGVRHAFGSLDRAVGEYRSATIRERRVRQRAFFGGRKEAEEDHAARESGPTDHPSSKKASE